MRKMIALATAAALLGGMATLSPAEARPGYRYHGGYHAYYARPYAYGYHRRNNAGVAVAAGLAGALLGGVIASQPRYGYAPSYGYPAYGAPTYYYDEGY
ncbi:hypothetical protein [Enterovirga sp.]|uniref:hypothetical protein n=1 Tax=Enterovirga sp. TaxID=2026350 RepID=UPI002B9A8A43|nr:hypothetical protein [Enterovirga sp.]HMO30800.1 hypothetical protein [Enterovirga sp.]